MSWTPLELAANLMTVICIFLAGRNNIHTWWTGIVACILFGVLFFQANLYADVTLQAFFIVTGIIGWIGWIKSNGEVKELPITRATPKTMGVMVGLAVLVAAGYGWLLHSFTNAYAPWIDSTVLTFSVIAQLLLMRRNLQNWPVWVLVNTLSVPLYWSRELYLTSALYAVFWVHALWAWRNWLDLMDEQVKPLKTFKTLNEA
jgi:nicotinamide mononucleotide transporter